MSLTAAHIPCAMSHVENRIYLHHRLEIDKHFQHASSSEEFEKNIGTGNSLLYIIVRGDENLFSALPKDRCCFDIIHNVIEKKNSTLF